MPKLLKTYSNFTGGLNTVDNDRTINDNELASLKDAVIDRRGFIVSSGRFADNTSDYRAPAIDASQAGYGLFQYKSDYDQAGNNESIVRTLLADADDGGEVEISVYSSDTNVWTDAQIGLGTVTSTEQGKVIYHIADGNVKICDTNTSNVSTVVKNYRYLIPNSRFKTGVSSFTSTTSAPGWKSFNTTLLAPTVGICGEHIIGTTAASGNSTTALVAAEADAFIGGSGVTAYTFNDALDLGTYWATRHTEGLGTRDELITSQTNATTLVMPSSGAVWADGEAYAIYPPIATETTGGFNVDFTASSGGSWSAGDYKFASSFVYTGGEESLLYELPGRVTVTANQKITGTILAHDNSNTGTIGYSDDIIGGRIYYKESSSDDAWGLFADISIEKGARASLDGSYVYCSKTIVGTTGLFFSEFVSLSQNIDTYESINGFSPDTQFLTIGLAGEKYQTSVVTNRRVFVANVKYVDKTNALQNHGDQIRYSLVNKFNSFPEFNFIDIGVNDGEEFIKLESYADRLLAFKEKTLYVINIGGGSDTQWFLESEHKNMGVGFHAATVKTDFGIAWVNKNGLYFYDGSQIRNLQTKIHQSDDVGEIPSWNKFINKTYVDTMIGYEPKRKHLIIIRNAGSAQYDGNSGDAFIYSFETNTFSFVENFAPDAVKTNMITDAYNNLSVGTALDEIETYDGDPAASLSGGGFGITLKNDDFGLPGVVKKVYGMTVEYSSSHSSGSIDFKYYHTDSAGTKQGIASAFTPPATAGDLDVFQQEFKNSGSLAPISANSFQPFFGCHNLDGIHKVHSVTVEYRPIKKRIT